ncbi:hypothetical protein OEA41_006064 [Lepraria neglecta]|uniref:Uncharacterized protein n=1 Tax=Lepraria neglecta TaxID=209136 RepID=A0AAD9Z7A7_9LECA|nr:hypothetical protein OEA41_006064 [Lepraria neglecta]
MVLYDEKKHVRQPVTKSIDRKNYATNQIEWIIKKGEPIDPEKPIDLQRIRIFTSDATRIWYTHIVMSLNKPDRLPINTLNADASSVCRIKYDLSNVPLDQFEMKKGPSEKLKFNGQPYYNIHHEAKITVGPADLKFEIWYKGAQYGKDNIAVEWDKAPAPHTPTPGPSRFQNFSLPVR